MMRVHACLLASAAAACASLPGVSYVQSARDEFAWSIPIEVPSGAPVARLDLPLVVYRDCVSPVLSDLRILNGAGEVVPYALQQPEPAALATPTTLRLPLFPLRGDAAVSGAALQLRIDGGKTSIEVEGAPAEPAPAPVSGYFVNASSLDRAIDTLTFGWPDEAPDFAANLVLAASDDLVNWRVVVPRAPLARLRHGDAIFEQRSVLLSATRARFWRVSAERDGELPQITSADATLVIASVPLERLQLEVGGRAAPQSPGLYEFDLGAQLPVDRVELALPDVNTVAKVEFFARRTAAEDWRLLNSVSVYRLQTANGELLSPPLAVRGERARLWRVKVDQRGGGIGGGVPRLRAGWLPDRMVFVTRGEGPFELVYGSAAAPGAEVPLDSLLPTGDTTLGPTSGPGLPVAHAGEPREAGGPDRLLAPAPPRPWRAWIMWAALIAGVATLGTMAWSLARQMRVNS